MRNCFGLERKRLFCLQAQRGVHPVCLQPELLGCLSVGHLVFNPISTGSEAQPLFYFIKVALPPSPGHCKVSDTFLFPVSLNE